MTRTNRIIACSIASLLVLTAACSDPISPHPAADLAASFDAGREGGMVATPFQARFFTDQTFIGPDAACELPRFFVVQEGSGEATHLGRFDIRITFCIDPTDILDDGTLTEGESAPYDDGVGTLTAANGDQLHILIAGAVVPTDEPGYSFEFNDPFSFDGGTGRFAGAAGGGITNSFVDRTVVPTRTTHVWTGTLSRPR